MSVFLRKSKNTYVANSFTTMKRIDEFYLHICYKPPNNIDIGGFYD